MHLRMTIQFEGTMEPRLIKDLLPDTLALDEPRSEGDTFTILPVPEFSDEDFDEKYEANIINFFEKNGAFLKDNGATDFVVFYRGLLF